MAAIRYMQSAAGVVGAGAAGTGVSREMPGGGSIMDRVGGMCGEFIWPSCGE